MRIRAVAATAAVLVGLVAMVPVPAVHAAGTHHFLISLFAHSDIGAATTVQLFDAGNTDVAPLCEIGAVINPEYNDWNCEIDDGQHTLKVTAPPSVAVDIHCLFDDLSVATSNSGTIVLPSSPAPSSCYVFTTPDTSYPSRAQVSLTVEMPSADAAIAHVGLFNGATELTAGCTTGASRLCTAVPYADYEFKVADAPSGMHATFYCSIFRTSVPFFEISHTATLVIGPSFQSAWCTVVAARPQVEIIGSYPPDGPPPTFALHPLGGGSDVACVTTGSWRWTCLQPGAGSYELVTDFVSTPTYPHWNGCAGAGTTEPSPGTTFPPTFVFADSDMDWYHCTFSASEPPPPTTPDSSDPSVTYAPLPANGGGGAVWPLALVMLVAGAAMMRLARRPLR